MKSTVLLVHIQERGLSMDEQAPNCEKMQAEQETARKAELESARQAGIQDGIMQARYAEFCEQRMKLKRSIYRCRNSEYLFTAPHGFSQ
jgi:hypothetical protein